MPNLRGARTMMSSPDDFDECARSAARRFVLRHHLGKLTASPSMAQAAL
jgi:hypothetical protein